MASDMLKRTLICQLLQYFVWTWWMWFFFGVTIYTTSCCCSICCWAYGNQWLPLCWNLRRALFARSYSSTTRLDVLESLDDTLRAIQGQNQTTGLWGQVCCGFPKYLEVYNCLGNWCHFDIMSFWSHGESLRFLKVPLPLASQGQCCSAWIQDFKLRHSKFNFKRIAQDGLCGLCKCHRSSCPCWRTPPFFLGCPKMFKGFQRYWRRENRTRCFRSFRPLPLRVLSCKAAAKPPWHSVRSNTLGTGMGGWTRRRMAQVLKTYAGLKKRYEQFFWLDQCSNLLSTEYVFCFHCQIYPNTSS